MSENQDGDNENRGMSVGAALSASILWLIALGGVFASIQNPIYAVASAIAAGFLFRRLA